MGPGGEASRGHGVGGRNGQHGLQPGIEKPPVTRLRAGMQFMMLRHRPTLRLWLQFPSAARHCILPQVVAVVVEDELRLFGSGEPVVTRQLALELAGSPAGIAEREEALLGTLTMADVEEDLTARGHCHAAIDIDGLGAPIFGAVEDKAEFRLHWAAGEDAHDARYAGVIMTGRLQQGRNRALADRAVYHDPQSSLLVVP